MDDLSKLLDKLPSQRRDALAELIAKDAGEFNCFSLSFAQERLWFLDRLEPNSPFYNIAAAIRITGALRVDAFKKAFTELIRRHEILRTCFPLIGAEPAQVILPPYEADLREKDLTEMEEQQGEAEAYRLAQLEALSPFDLQGSPPLRLLLMRLSDSLHVLSVSLHHIIADGWSMGVLVREVALLYEAYTKGEASPLAELPIQYADYAVWQRQRVESGALEHQRSYWERKLRGAEAKLELATDRARPAVQSYRGGRQRLEIGEEEVRRLKEVGQQEGATLYMVMLAGFGVLMRSYSGQEEVLVGTPVAGRWREEMEGLIGLMVNTVVMKVKVRGEASVREVMRGVREEAIEAYENEELPYEKVVEAVRPGRDVSHTPIVQVMMALQNAPTTDFRLQGLHLSVMDIEIDTAKSDLAVEMEETQQGLTGSIEYNAELFEASTITRMAAHFQNLLQNIARNPDQRISELQIMSEDERRQLLVEWNDTRFDYDYDLCIHELFEEQVRRTPDATAVIFEDVELSYVELNARANRLAHYLIDRGVGPEALVGICVERSLEMLVGIIGILKAGGAYVPLDPEYPKERIAFALEDSQASVLLTQESLKGYFAQRPENVICLDSDWEEVRNSSPENPDSKVAPFNLAYVIYTSGSTGLPKGVMISHRAVCNRLVWGQQVYPMSKADAVLQITSLSFDVSVSEFFAALIAGAKLVIALPGGHRNPNYLVSLITEREISLINVVPSLLHVLLDEPKLEACESLRYVICGGEALPPELMKRYFTRLSAELHNIYGPTEVTIDASFWKCDEGYERPVLPIGRPVGNAQSYVLDAQQGIVPVGVPGELYIGGVGLARGYINRPDLTAEKFIPNPFGQKPGERLYRTGDLVRHLPDGNLEFIGRADSQVKIRGYRVELGEIEATLYQHSAIQEAVVTVNESVPGNKRIVAYVVIARQNRTTANNLRSFLAERLPAYMVPSTFVMLQNMPLLPDGKIDRHALPKPERFAAEGESYELPRGEVEKTIASIWQDLLQMEKVGRHDNFFDLGGHSLLLIQIHNKLRDAFQMEIPLIDLFKYPTVSSMARYLSKEDDRPAPPRENTKPATGSKEIAIIGMAGRFPGARNIEEYWRNLREGVESISFFTDEQMLKIGISPEVVSDPKFVKAGGVLEDIELFDSQLFGFNPREADIMDPQHRLFLECAYEALENAGYGSEKYRSRTGVFAGESLTTYLVNNVLPHRWLIDSVGEFQTMIGNDRDHLTTIVSYKLNLKGPSLNIQTACSTSLVAVHMACQSLLIGDCDMALTGGVSINVPQEHGYIYEEGGYSSPDGHCRAFDRKARGAISGNGVGVVVLKRLPDAITDGDTIHAVIKGSAINNDGSSKVGYTAPSIDGQAEVIAAAQAAAGVEAETIGYIEAHGTGTALGDPIEVAALTQAFSATTTSKQFCAIGSVKTNIGHLDAAAGIAGLIKAVLAVEHGQIPASLHYSEPNPEIEFSNSPFYVSERLSEWGGGGQVRRAGVSSFGIGGTNAHVIIEEWPRQEQEQEQEEERRGRPEVVMISARSPVALEETSERLRRHLEEGRGGRLEDVAYTLQEGRKAYEHRRVVVASTLEEVVRVLENINPEHVITSFEQTADQPVVFMFPGGGAQHVNMAKGIYQFQPVFSKEVDTCAEILKPHLGVDVRSVIYPSNDKIEEASRKLAEPFYALPSLFVIEYALAKLLMEWGIRPRAAIGHSLGEYVAACIAGVLSIEDALALVALRGRLFKNIPAGAMLSLPLPAESVQPLLNDDLSIAAINGPSLCLVSGPTEAIDEFQKIMTERGIDFRRIHISAAGHSPMVNPILKEFTDFVRTLNLHSPSLPYISNVTGGWVRGEEVKEAEYWGRQMRQEVRYREGMEELLREEGGVYVEVGPGRAMSSLARQQRGWGRGRVAVSLMRQAQMEESDEEELMRGMGRMWASGVEIEWERVRRKGKRRRVELPSYPFEGRRHWIDAKGREEERAVEEEEMRRHARPEVSSGYEKPRDEVEVRVAEIWEELLGIGGVGVNDNFFELGGHSLLGTQLVTRLREEFGVGLPLRCIFEFPTVVSLARTITEMQSASNAETLSDLLEDIKQLSSEEVHSMLVKERQLMEEELND